MYTPPGWNQQQRRSLNTEKGGRLGQTRTVGGVFLEIKVDFSIFWMIVTQLNYWVEFQHTTPVEVPSAPNEKKEIEVST